MKKREESMRWALVAMVAAGSAAPLVAQTPQSGTANGEWSYWGGDERSSGYSPLDQINAENVSKLEVVWRWKAANYGPNVDYIYRERRST
jgi:quinoprotein glucose dehydrogenase